MLPIHIACVISEAEGYTDKIMNSKPNKIHLNVSCRLVIYSYLLQVLS